MSEPHRAAEVVSYFEATIVRLRAKRGDGDPLAMVDAAFAAVHACYPDLSEAEVHRAAEIRQFNAYSSLFEAAHGRDPGSRGELFRWLATPDGRAAMHEIGTAAR